MKTKTLIIALMAMMVIFVGPILAQSNYQQNKNLARLAWPSDDWYYFQNNNETKNLANIWFEDIVAEDTLWTDTYYTWPYMYLEAATEDTGATDSVYLKIELWMTESSDTTRFQLIKTLLWHPDDGGTAVNTMAVVDNWWCYIGDTPYPGFTYHRLRIIAYGDHAKLIGQRLFIRAQAHSLER